LHLNSHAISSGIESAGSLMASIGSKHLYPFYRATADKIILFVKNYSP
jgi:hypothetical protein